MASLILRCGPYGHVGNGDTRPFQSSGASGAYPVNCAKSGWPSQSWAAIFVRSGNGPGSIPVSGSCGLGATLTTTRASAFVILNFCYQATSAFNISIQYSFTSVTPPATLSTSYIAEVFTLEGGGGSSGGSGTSGSISTSCPASLLGRFRFRIDGITSLPPPSPRRETTLSVTIT